MFEHDIVDLQGNVIGSFVFIAGSIILLRKRPGTNVAQVFLAGKQLGVNVIAADFVTFMTGNGFNYPTIKQKNALGADIADLWIPVDVVGTPLSAYRKGQISSDLVEVFLDDESTGPIIVDKSDFETILIAQSLLVGPTP